MNRHGMKYQFLIAGIHRDVDGSIIIREKQKEQGRQV